MLNKRDIKRLKEGHIPFALEHEPFIIMRERVHLPGSDNGDWQWSINTSRSEDDMTIITREEALEIITEHHMFLAHSQAEGQIFEMEGLPFKKNYSDKKLTS